MIVDGLSRIQSRGNQPHIVIPYSYADNEFARRLARALRSERVTPWIDDVDMSAGVILVNRIARALLPVDFVIPVISAASTASGWVLHDLKAVIARESSARPVRVLLARIDSTALPDHLKSQPFLDFYGHGWKKAYNDLTAIVFRRDVSPRPTMPTTPAFDLPHPIRRPQPGGERVAEAKVVFVSYDHENDGYYKDVLLAWSKSPDFPRLSVNEEPITAPVDSDEAEPLKRVVYGKIKAASAFLCVVGAKTGTSGWVNWEIKTAIDLEKRIIVARVNRDCVAPELLSEVGPTCALSFTFEGIKRAVAEAYGVVAPE